MDRLLECPFIPLSHGWRFREIAFPFFFLLLFLPFFPPASGMKIARKRIPLLKDTFPSMVDRWKRGEGVVLQRRTILERDDSTIEGSGFLTSVSAVKEEERRAARLPKRTLSMRYVILSILSSLVGSPQVARATESAVHDPVSVGIKW